MLIRRIVPVLLLGALLAVGIPALLRDGGERAAGDEAAFVPPRLPTGEPDLEGIWNVTNTARYDLEDHSARPGVPAGPSVVEGGDIPYQKWALEVRKKNFANSRTSDPVKSADPLARCYMPGVPRATYMGWPFQIFQTPGYIAILYEWTHLYRVIHMSPEAKLRDDVPSWMGTSRGRWEGNTLVVDVRHFNNRTWFDMAGNFHSEALRVTERYTLLDANTLQYEATIEDPKVFARPWKMSMHIHRQREAPLLEYECVALLDEAGIPLTWPRE